MWRTHIFKTRYMSTGQVKVVHHNLLLPVNFLPLDKAEYAASGRVSSLSVTDSCDKANESLTSMVVDGSKSELCVGDGELAQSYETSESAKPDDGLSLNANVSSATADSCDRTSDWVSGLPDRCSQLGSATSSSSVNSLII